MTLAELRREKKLFYSVCCEAKFKAQSNGLYTNYICCDCGKPTIPVNGKGKMIDLHGEIKKIKK